MNLAKLVTVPNLIDKLAAKAAELLGRAVRAYALRTRGASSAPPFRALSVSRNGLRG